MKKVVTLFVLSLLSIGLFAQQKQISGVVVDEKGESVIGASVQVKGTTIGTITDFDGQFVLTVDNDAKTLIISYVGMQTQEVAIKGTNMRVVMRENSEVIQEVVVTGYGNVTKGSFAGSAQSVNSETIEKKAPSEISKALAGEVAGVQVINTSGQPGTNATIVIRGLGSANAQTTPLYIVDGVTYNGDISAIDPGDIASTTVLKDATATSLYGSRGANGVIVITTKKGKQDEDAKIDVDVTYGANMHLLPMYDVITDPQEYLGLAWQSLKNNLNNDGDLANKNLFSPTGLPAIYNLWVDEDGNTAKAPFFDENGEFYSNLRLKDCYQNMPSWKESIFRTGQKANTTVRISGGNSKVSYFSSFSYLKDEGYYIGSDYDRFTTRNNVDFQAKKWLKGTVSLAYTYSNLNNPGQGGNMNNGFAYVNGIPPIYPVYMYDEDGNIMKDPKTGGNAYDYGMHEGYGRGFGSGINPAGALQYDKARTMQHQVIVNGMLEFKLYKDLKLEVTAGTQYQGINSSSLTNKYYGDAAGLGRISKGQTNYTFFETKQLLKYNKVIGDHTIDALAGHELSYSRNQSMSAGMNRIADPNSLELSNAIQMSYIESGTNETALQSVLAQANYIYGERYMVTANYRADGSSKIAKGKRWGHFGSVGLGWVFTNEQFVQAQETFSEWIRDAKLRFSWGVLGNQGIGADLFQDHYSIEYVDGQIGYIWNYKGAPDLTWERTQTVDLGLEFSINKYLDAEFDQMLMPRYQAPSIGYSSVYINGGKMTNQGVEFQANVHALDMRNIKLDIRLNGGHYHNNIEELPKSIDSETEMTTNGGLFVGHSMLDWKLPTYVGVNPANGKAMYVGYYDRDKGSFGDTKEASQITDEDLEKSKTGMVDNYISDVYKYRLEHPNADIDTVHTDDARLIGSDFIGKTAEPALDGGFGIDFEAYGFTLNVMCSYRLGGWGYDNTYAMLMANEKVGNYNWHIDMRNAWTPENTDTDIPRLNNGTDTYTNTGSTRFLTSNSYLSLNNIRLGYKFQKKLVEKIKLSRLELYLQADNLAIASARRGYNPTSSLDGSSSAYRYTPLSTIIGGVKIQF